jgi:tRNA A37 threonylcarbamoyladenosine synthetase subunit TsaC/SUA5/YrdC
MDRKISEIIKKNGVGVLPTDTLYGLVGSAFSKEAVDRIYDLKSRNEKKSLIILISSIEDLEKFGVKITESAKKSALFCRSIISSCLIWTEWVELWPSDFRKKKI